MSNPSAPSGADERFMARAIELATAQLGRTAPNPSVGCVIARDGVIVGEGATGDGGRPHAEEIAIASAGEKARGATAYVTLEPCAKRSSDTPSCSQLLVDAGVRRVVAACEETHLLSAQGTVRLKAAGIEVALGLSGKDAEHLSRGFHKLLDTGRPLLAIDADPSTYDAGFDLKRDETYEAALDRLGKEGRTRVFIRPGTPLAAQLKARGLVDEDRSQVG